MYPCLSLRVYLCVHLPVYMSENVLSVCVCVCVHLCAHTRSRKGIPSRGTNVGVMLRTGNPVPQRLPGTGPAGGLACEHHTCNAAPTSRLPSTSDGTGAGKGSKLEIPAQINRRELSTKVRHITYLPKVFLCLLRAQYVFPK